MQSLEVTAARLNNVFDAVLADLGYQGGTVEKGPDDHYSFQFTPAEGEPFVISINGRGNDEAAYYPEMLRKIANILLNIKKEG